MPGPYNPGPLEPASISLAGLGAYVLTELRKLAALSKTAERDTAGSTTVTSNYTIRPSDAVVRADATGGAITLTLPAAQSMVGNRVTVKRLNSGANLVTLSAADLIDGSATAVLASQYARVTVLGVRDGTDVSYDIV